MYSSNMIKIEHKVRIVGSYYSDKKLTDNLAQKMIQHSDTQRGQKVKLKLTLEGLRITRSLFSPKLQEPGFITFRDIVHVGRHKSNPSNILCVTENLFTSDLKIIMFRCYTVKDAADYAEGFTAIKSSSKLNGPKLKTITTEDNDPQWITDGVTFSGTKHKVSSKRSEIKSSKVKPAIKKEEVHLSNAKQNHVYTHKSQSFAETQQSWEPTESLNDVTYAQVRKHVKSNSDQVDSTNKIIKETDDSREVRQQTIIVSDKTQPSTEELHKEIQELKNFIRSSLPLSNTSTHATMEIAKEPLKINVNNDFVTESAPSSLHAYEQHSPGNRILNMSAVDLRANRNYNNNVNINRGQEFQSRHRVQSTSGDYLIHSDTEMAGSNVRRPGEARLRVDNFYNQYGTMPTQQRIALPVPRHNKVSSSSSEIGGTRLSNYNASTSTLPTKLTYRDGMRHASSVTNLYRSNTFNTDSQHPTLRKVTWAEGSRLSKNPSDTIAKPIEKVYPSNQARNIMYVNSRNARPLSANVRMVNGQQPNYVLRSADSVGDVCYADILH